MSLNAALRGLARGGARRLPAVASSSTTTSREFATDSAIARAAAGASASAAAPPSAAAAAVASDAAAADVALSSASSAHPSSEELMQMEEKYSAHNYHPLPVVFSRASGAHAWDPEGRQYLDCLSAYSAVNQGHAHPKILQALVDQSQRCTLTSRAFHNDQFPEFAKFITSLFGYDKVLPMNTGAEGVETALKLARKWAYMKKGVTHDKAVVVSCCGCFHGRTMAAISMSCDNDATRGFGPLLPGQLKVDYGDIDGLKKVLEEHGANTAAFLFEPIQGEAGVVVPPDGYYKAVRELCTRHNVLMIADEIQTGLGRTGFRLACDYEGVRPDLVILGKALGGGVLPVSAVLADDDVMLCIHPGEHGSTFGGNPLSSAVAMASLKVLEEEQLIPNARRLGVQLQEQLFNVQLRYPSLVRNVRGRGLLAAVEMDQIGMGPGVSAMDVCLAMKDRGVLAKPTHSTIIRLAPPLTITDEDVAVISSVLEAVLERDIPLLQERAAKNKSAQKVEKEPCDRCGRIL